MEGFTATRIDKINGKDFAFGSLRLCHAKFGSRMKNECYEPYILKFLPQVTVRFFCYIKLTGQNGRTEWNFTFTGGRLGQIIQLEAVWIGPRINREIRAMTSTN